VLEALGLDGTEHARGYLQHWLANNEFREENSERIIKTAHRILAAGRHDITGTGSPKGNVPLRSLL
jgi:hypothetical protein